MDLEAEKKVRQHGARRKVKIFIALIVILAAAAIWFTGSLDSAKTPDSDSVVMVEIKEGSTTADIAETLEEKGIISSAFKFRLKSRIDGYDGQYIAGVYELSASMTPGEIMSVITSGESNQTKLTIPEGYTLEQTAQTVEEAGICTADEFLSETQNGSFDYKFMEYAGTGENRLEGFLYPETYFIPDGVSAHDVIDILLTQFDKIFTDEYYDRATQLGYTPDQIITVASMIQRETLVQEEGAKVASVIYNRLAQGMKLQIDATVQYALGSQKDRLTYSDLAVDSPYNTYKIDGLPPGPICSPHESAIEAALWPESTNYLYYVLKPDGSGQHNFAETDEEFSQYREEYLNSLE